MKRVTVVVVVVLVVVTLRSWWAARQAVLREATACCQKSLPKLVPSGRASSLNKLQEESWAAPHCSLNLPHLQSPLNVAKVAPFLKLIFYCCLKICDFVERGT